MKYSLYNLGSIIFIFPVGLNVLKFSSYIKAPVQEFSDHINISLLSNEVDNNILSLNILIFLKDSVN